MVRLHWHVEDGRNAFVPPGAMRIDGKDIAHADVQIELAQEGSTMSAAFTMPAAYQTAQQGSGDVGMVLSLDAVDWQQRLAAGLATRLAPVSCVVVARTTAQPAEPVHDAAVRLEKVLDACATSPYARNAKRWVLAGIGSQGTAAALAGQRCRGAIAGFALIGFPFEAPVPSHNGAGDAAPPGDALLSPENLLHQLNAPTLFVNGEKDEHCRPHVIQQACSDGRLPAHSSARVEMLPGLGSSLASADGAVSDETCDQVGTAISTFVSVLHRDVLSSPMESQLHANAVLQSKPVLAHRQPGTDFVTQPEVNANVGAGT